jgi:hypothetical protein
MYLRAELYKVKLDNEGCGTVSGYIARIQSLYDQISIAGQTITDTESYFHLLNGLPSEWGNYKDIIASTIPDVENWKNIIPNLKTKESELKYKKGVSTDAALYMKGQTNARRKYQHIKSDKNTDFRNRVIPKFDGECNLCGKKGHKKYDCWNNDRNKDKCPKHWRVPRKHYYANHVRELSDDETEINTM